MFGPRSVCACLLALLCASIAVADDEAASLRKPDEPVATRGPDRRLGSPPAAAQPRPTGRQFALVIGVNYAGRAEALANPADADVVRPLRNAVQDAEVLRDVLTTYYGYRDADAGLDQDGRFAADTDEVVLLTEDRATKDAIETALGDLCNSELIGEDDSVVVFFSGHGVRLPGVRERDRAAILAWDVQVAGGRPTSKFLRLHSDVIERLADCPARQRLVVLDSCYSGEIFHAGFQARSDADDRSDVSLQMHRGFQAMASCRATQVALDEAKTERYSGHSPFTAALLDGLKRIPAQPGADRRVSANRLLAYIRPHFLEEREQSPDCRSLNGLDGEFCFFPVDRPELFAPFRVSVSEQNLLNAMLASRQGGWWFQDMPWFIPSVREEIIHALDARQAQTRTSADVVRFIDPKDLAAAAEDALERLRGAGTLSDLDAMRERHFRLLKQDHRGQKQAEILQQIVDELESLLEPPAIAARSLSSAPTPNDAVPGATPPTQDTPPAARPDRQSLNAADVHLLALAQHALHRGEQACLSYERALKLYAEDASGDRSSRRILEALCRADYGELLLLDLRDSIRSADQFHKADELLSSLGAEIKQQHAVGVFRVYILCKEAQARLEQNRWTEANRLLKLAVSYADFPGSTSYMMAHVQRQIAWARMIQWDVQEASRYFARSNAILVQLLDVTGGAGEGARPTEDQPPATPDAAHEALVQFEVPDAVRQADDFALVLAYLHNLHGIAMSQRFQGRSRFAAEQYRALTGEVADALHRVRDSAASNEFERLFVERVINTQERLGDCNLFGDPSVCDLTEAADDYRRAMRFVHQLRGRSRDQWQAVLMYKQALALSQPSPVQDTRLALEIAAAADKLFQDQAATASGQFLALGRLSTPVAAVCHAANAALAEAPASGRQAAPEAADLLPPLRQALLGLRDEMGHCPHRDQLELCLFASRILLLHSGGESRYQRLEDADLLLSFCRLALSQGRQDGESLPSGDARNAREYLRPYFDAAFRTRREVAPRQVKDLLELHWEATRGATYLKRQSLVPVLALYVLDGEPYLIVDVPSGSGRCLVLSESCDPTALHRACQKGETPVSLPFEAYRLLEDWRNAHGPEGQVEWWFDDARFGVARNLAETGTRPASRPRIVAPQCPFRLPDGLNSVMPADQSPGS